MIGPTLVAFAYDTKIILSAAINSEKFSLGYSSLINLGPVGEWGKLPTCHSRLILTTARYQQPSLLTFQKSILSNHYFGEKKTLHKLQLHPSLQTNLPTLLNRLSPTAGINLLGC